MWLSNKLRQKRGGVAVMVGLSIVVLFGFAALVIDVGYALVARNQLHNIADASALAATRELGRKYLAMTSAERSTYVLTTLDRTDIETQGINVAQLNYATGISFTLDPTDIEIGQWDPDSKTFTVTDNQPNAVHVTSRRDTTQADGPISMFFARILGITTMNVRADATAALGGPGTALTGEVDLPIALDNDMWNNTSCGDNIVFYPTSDDSCAGWTTFDRGTNASDLSYIIDGMNDNTYLSPEIDYGSDVNIGGGNVASALPDLKALFDTKKVLAEPYDSWDAKVLIVDNGDSDCGNFNQTAEMVGIATINITNVLAPPDGQLIEGTLQCYEIADVPGGGFSGGTTATIPKLVQ